MRPQSQARLAMESAATSEREKLPNLDDRWRPRPRRLLIGLGLVVVGAGWMIANGQRQPAAVSRPVATHGPVATRVLSLDGLRARPQLLPGATGAGLELMISFHNDAGTVRRVAPGDLRLVEAGRTYAPQKVAQMLRPADVQPGRFVSGVLAFNTNLVPGATIIFAPPWAHGRALHWLMWR